MSHLLNVPGLRVGHATDAAARTGTTSVVMDEPSIVGVAVVGGAPGTRETDALSPGGLAPPVDAVVLSGGSAFGLAAADGAQRALAERGRGFAVGPHRVPIVPAAIVFDLTDRPRADYAELGGRSVCAALDGEPDRGEGTLGAGTGATTADLKGGIGSASTRVDEACVGALVVMNAVGSAVAGNGPWFHAAKFEEDGELGGLKAPADADWRSVRTKLDAAPGTSTVVAVVATDATLTQAAATRLARTAHDGIALAVWPAHTLFDGDTIFAVSTARGPEPASPSAAMRIGIAATTCLARACARALYAASASRGDRLPTWHDAHRR